MHKPLPTNGKFHKDQIRCAIYTRKSSEEGLEQDFNSLDAQREACEAYVRSQRDEGWQCLPTMYDDGGISGATMERPALRRLLADIASGAIDSVVVYKVDRLTRSLADFAKIVEVFDAQGVSFVSVTQQFNTVTSMGRLTLNMLLSFAQFEREVTGERIRDKIAASKRRGMWMGGLPPLGYDLLDKKLIVNEVEAESVRDIYRRYVRLGSVLALKEELDRDGIRSKVRVDQQGRQYGNQPLTRGALYLMLQNHLYRGEIEHKQAVYPGEHLPIVDFVLWDAVQVKLSQNRVARVIGSDAESPSLLAGVIFDETGERMSPTHSNKSGKRYRYYISQALIKGRRGVAPSGQRLPAGEVETLVNDRLRQFLTSQTEVFAAIESGDVDHVEAQGFVGKANELAQKWPQMSPSDQRQTLLALLERVDIGRDSIEVRINSKGLVSILRGEAASPDQPKKDETGRNTTCWTIPVRLRRTGIEKRLLIDGASNVVRRAPDRSLSRLIAQAHLFQAMLMRGEGKTLAQLAKEAGVAGSYFTRVVRLSFLAPDIVKTILSDQHPINVSATRLVNDSRLPVSWQAQRAHLAFS